MLYFPTPVAWLPLFFYFSMTNSHLKYVCCRFCQCFCSPCSIKVNVEEYYREKLKELQVKIFLIRTNKVGCIVVCLSINIYYRWFRDKGLVIKNGILIIYILPYFYTYRNGNSWAWNQKIYKALRVIRSLLSHRADIQIEYCFQGHGWFHSVMGFLVF